MRSLSWNLWPLIPSNLSKHMQSIWLFPKLYCSWRWSVCVFLQLRTVELRVRSSLWVSYYTHSLHKLQYIWQDFFVIIKVFFNRDVLLHVSFTFLCFLWRHICDPPQLKSISHTHVPPINTHAHTHTPSHALLWLSPFLLVSIECLSETLLFVFLLEATSQNHCPACTCGCLFECEYWHVQYVHLSGI